MTPIAIIGAGPYGLSIAAHLSAKGLDPVIFGSPMASWGTGMPRGMRLKSDGFASCLSDPDGSFTLKAFCEQEGIPYGDTDHPVPVGTFVAYGKAFQRRFVPQLDRREVVSLRKLELGFRLGLDDGTVLHARHVIVATGIRPLKTVPAVLAGLPAERVSHTSDHADYGQFAGRRVAVIGAGASAIDAAAEGNRAGATVSLVSRKASFRFYAGGGRRRLRDRIMAPMTPLGPGWRKLLCVKAPLLFRLMPEGFRKAIVQRTLGPAPGWFVRDEVEGKVAFHLSATVVGARESNDRIALHLAGQDGAVSTIEVDHVIAGTGYSLDVKRLRFLDPGLVAGLALFEKVPRLSTSFESSIPGLHFVGTLAAYEFGPLLRFVCGAEFTARRVAAAIAATERRLRRSSGTRRAPNPIPVLGLTDHRQPV